jgi:uncharacterized protein (TIGR03067 family)
MHKLGGLLMKRFNRFSLTFLLSLFLMVTLSFAGDLTGTWTGHEVQGAPGKWTFIFTDSTLVVYGPNQGDYYKLDTEKVDNKEKPHIKAVFKDSSDPSVINMKSKAIYKFEKEKLIVAASEPGYGGIPSSFDAKWGVFVFELIKETKSE